MFDYETKIQHWINRLSFLLRAEAQARLRAAGHDLSAEEWALMMILWRDGPSTMTRLADLTLRDRTTVTRLVDRLAKKRLVTRKEGARDRRQVIVEVTEHARDIEQSVQQVMLPLIRKSSAGISQQELDQARDVLQRMAQNLDTAQGGATG